MVYSINGNKVIDLFSTKRLMRSTHQICLNCGSCAEEYGFKYCHYCFERDNWGTIRDYMELLNEIDPDFLNSENSINLVQQQKIDYNSFYAQFWYFYNDTYDFFLNTYEKYFKNKKENYDLTSFKIPIIRQPSIYEDLPQEESLKQPFLSSIPEEKIFGEIV